MTVQIVKGLPDVLRRDAAKLYWAAFGGKLGKVMGPTPLALEFLVLAMRSDHTIVAVDARGGLLGVAGFKTDAGTFAGGTLTDLRKIYGRWGAAWRAALLNLLVHDTENAGFVLEGICVVQAERSKGVGTRLLEALLEEGKARHQICASLEVADSNPRARALYQRHGFEPVGTQKLGLLRFVFGYASSTKMKRQL